MEICERPYIGRPPHCGDMSCTKAHPETKPRYFIRRQANGWFIYDIQFRGGDECIAAFWKDCPDAENRARTAAAFLNEGEEETEPAADLTVLQRLNRESSKRIGMQKKLDEAISLVHRMVRFQAHLDGALDDLRQRFAQQREERRLDMLAHTSVLDRLDLLERQVGGLDIVTEVLATGDVEAPPEDGVTGKLFTEEMINRARQSYAGKVTPHTIMAHLQASHGWGNYANLAPEMLSQWHTMVHSDRTARYLDHHHGE